MGKFNGILIASDWDGTVYYKGSIHKDTIDAIRYFQQNGGLFTICSGRFNDFLETFSSSIKPNTYLICCNGAYIVDTESRECLYEGFCDDHLFLLTDRIFENGSPISEVRFFCKDKCTHIEVKSKEEYYQKRSLLRNTKIYKAVAVYKDELYAIADKEMLEDSNILKDYIAVRSWSVGLELIKYSNSKGVAVRRVADKVNANLIITAGDYENDIELLKSADIGYAVMNATDSLKAVADRVTVSADNAALAKIISDIEKEFCKA